MGMQPAPAQPGGSMLARERSTLFDGSNVRVEVRQTSSMLELYLPEIDMAGPIDSQALLPGEEARVIAAFEDVEQDIVAIRLDVDGVSFWRAYLPVDGAYARDMALSDLISDAEDEAEARALLAAR